MAFLRPLPKPAHSCDALIESGPPTPIKVIRRGTGPGKGAQAPPFAHRLLGECHPAYKSVRALFRSLFGCGPVASVWWTGFVGPVLEWPRCGRHKAIMVLAVSRLLCKSVVKASTPATIM